MFDGAGADCFFFFWKGRKLRFDAKATSFLGYVTSCCGPVAELLSC
jgi:hypothetical protein